MKKLTAMVPFVALLTGCPIGPGGIEGEGEGEQKCDEEHERLCTPTLSMAFPTPIASVLLDETEEACDNELAHEYAVPSEEVGDSMRVKPVPADPARACATMYVEEIPYRDFSLDWTGQGGCSLAPSGRYLSTGGSDIEVTMTDQEQMEIHGDGILPDELCPLVMTDDEYYGECDVNGVHLVVSGAVSNDRCQIIYHEERDGSTYGDTILIHQTPECLN